MKTIDELNALLDEGKVVALGRFERDFEKAAQAMRNANEDAEKAMTMVQRELEFMGDAVPAVVEMRPDIIEMMNNAKKAMGRTFQMCAHLRGKLKPEGSG